MDNPYVGLNAFGSDDAHRFFGRSREARDLAYLWRSNRVVVLFGPSGIGKSSLLRAGAIPRLRPDASDLLAVGRLAPGTSFPAPSLEDHNPYTFSLLSSWSPAESPSSLVGKTISEFLLERTRTTGRYEDPVPIFAAIDQYEEVLNTPPAWQRSADEFRGELNRALKDVPHLRLLIAVRGDAVAGMLDRETNLGAEHQALMRLEPLSPSQALAAITDPLEETAQSYAPGVAEALLDDLRTVRIRDVLGAVHEIEIGSVEPWQLQLVCTRLWDRLPPGREVISMEDVREFGSVGQTLLETCQREVVTVAERLRLATSDVWIWLRSHFITEFGTRAQVYEGPHLTRGMPNPVPRDLENRHLLRSEWKHGVRWYELQHDRLIEPVRRAAQMARVAGDEGQGPQTPATLAGPNEYLQAAENALAEGHLALAKQYAKEAGRLTEHNAAVEAGWLYAEVESFLGNVEFHHGRLDDAERRYSSAIRLFGALGAKPAAARLMAAVGRIHLRRGRYAKAIETLQSSLKELPGDQTIRVDLARANWFEGQLGAARGLYDSVLAVTDNAEALSGRGRVSVELSDFDRAFSDLDRLFARYPSRKRDLEARAAHAVALAELGRTEEATAEIDAVLPAAADNGPVLLYATWVAQRCRDVKRARRLAQSALEATGPPLTGALFSRLRDVL
ncbi:tetratricopeptide repeat protein [Herbidospora daliensis]|uniref:tetratricopeptide repeat protein n=1 Tax=Herbidospora daliensis TaxID=295585 RepID=UPI0007854E58|nr:tetratricopeptide repeat protein [Herbidospora daliensis]